MAKREHLKSISGKKARKSKIQRLSNTAASHDSHAATDGYDQLRHAKRLWESYRILAGTLVKATLLETQLAHAAK